MFGRTSIRRECARAWQRRVGGSAECAQTKPTADAHIAHHSMASPRKAKAHLVLWIVPLIVCGIKRHSLVGPVILKREFDEA
jgi:hypothetical protein